MMPQASARPGCSLFFYKTLSNGWISGLGAVPMLAEVLRYNCSYIVRKCLHQLTCCESLWEPPNWISLFGPRIQNAVGGQIRSRYQQGLMRFEGPQCATNRYCQRALRLWPGECSLQKALPSTDRPPNWCPVRRCTDRVPHEPVPLSRRRFWRYVAEIQICLCREASLIRRDKIIPCSTNEWVSN